MIEGVLRHDTEMHVDKHLFAQSAIRLRSRAASFRQNANPAPIGCGAKIKAASWCPFGPLKSPSSLLGGPYVSASDKIH
jgi:hypothetical protein